MLRWHVACNRCDAAAWIGPRDGAVDAWCEACQAVVALTPRGDAGAPLCPRCRVPLTRSDPRFEELFGELQNLIAVLEAWHGKPARLSELLPERPRFLMDLSPPAPDPGDPADLTAALAALARGSFASARKSLDCLGPTRSGTGGLVGGAAARAWLALGIANQREGDLAAAEAAFTRSLDVAHTVAARLNRGTLRARRGDVTGARADFDRSGHGPEARWNRGALIVLDAVATTPGFPGNEVRLAARKACGPASDYWSDHTVGRLLFALLLERALSRLGDGGALADEQPVLRAAARELEFDTFWDRALVVHGYATLGMKVDAGAAAWPLALLLLGTLRAEPFALGSTGHFLAEALAAADDAVRAGSPEGALAVLAPLLEREDLRHYRVPCARCGAGTVGVDQCEESEV